VIRKHTRRATSRAGVTPMPLFQPPEAGLTVSSWDELDEEPKLPKCSECDRPLRSAESQESEIGPCCAAKIGRAVVAERKAARARRTA
jgi:hypothetical protein